MKNLRRSIIDMFACMILGVAKQASSQFSIVYYQSEVPEKLKCRRKENIIQSR